jgi:lactoylglutathione lyase
MKIIELNHIAIHVADVEKSVGFYRRVLLLEPIPRPAFDFPGAWFRLGRTNEPVLARSRNNHFALRVDGLDSWESHFKKVDADFRPKKQRPDGAWQIFVRDPDGHSIELFILS